MILLVAVLGIAVAWLLNPISELLLRLSKLEIARPAFSWRVPGVLRLFKRHPIDESSRVELGIELFTAGVFVLLYLLHGAAAQTLWLMIIYAFFALIALMDYRHRIVLNILTYSGLVIALAVNIILLQQPIAPILLGSGFAFGIFYLASYIRPGEIGGGDIKLAAVIGAALGFPFVLWALIIAAIASALTIVFLLVVRHYSLKDSIPYAPFLCLGAVVVIIYSSILTIA